MTDEVVKTRKQREVRPQRLILRVLDADGQAVKGASISVVAASRDPVKFAEAVWKLKDEIGLVVLNV